MTSQDFIKLYGLDGVRELVRERLDELEGSRSKVESLEAALKVETQSDHYDVRKRNSMDVIRFSTDNFRERSQDVLILLADVKYAWSLRRRSWSFGLKKRIVTALSYGLCDGGVVVNYVQSVSGIKLKQYKKVQELIGVRPHELLVAHLIARVAPVLDMYPNMNLSLPRGNRSSYAVISERFGKKNICSLGLKVYQLNPNKERVKQIFDPESPWLDARRG